jgi:hypothetical protein
MSLLDEDAARRLVHGAAGSSTALDRMNGQCLEVMSEYPRVIDATDGRHDLALGYGLVSHALDAKHLIAAIVYGIKLGHRGYRLVTEDGAILALQALLDHAAACTLGSPANELMHVRLQQAMRLLVDAHARLGLTPDRILAALQAH